MDFPNLASSQVYFSILSTGEIGRPGIEFWMKVIYELNFSDYSVKSNLQINRYL